MHFLTFNSQEERRKYGGTAFIEMQYCKMPSGTRIKKIVAIRSIKYWQDDSLYVYLDDIDDFWQNYSQYFDSAVYNNLESGPVDLYGINYYAPEVIDLVIERIHSNRPTEYVELVDWLNRAKKYNGFYILGI